MLACYVFTAVRACADSNIEAVLNSFIAGQRPMPDVMVTYEAGNQNFGGRTSLRILGDRSIELEYTHRGQTKNFKSRISEEGMMTLLKRMLNDKFWTASPAKRPRVPDETEIEISISTKQKDLNYTVKAPEVEALKSKELRTLVEIFRAVIKDVSKGEVKY